MFTLETFKPPSLSPFLCLYAKTYMPICLSMSALFLIFYDEHAANQLS